MFCHHNTCSGTSKGTVTEVKLGKVKGPSKFAFLQPGAPTVVTCAFGIGLYS